MSNVMDAHLLRFFTETSQLAEHHAYLKQQLQIHYLDVPNGNVQRWQAAVAELPEENHQPDFSSPLITIGALDDRLNLTPALQALMPWRKGPFQIHGIDIDTEWRSDWKWDRIAPHIQPLGGRQVLDIGTGNGYFLLRMLGAGADIAVGADPTLLFYHQFLAIQKLIAPEPAYLLPLAGEHLPAFNHFDTVFSLGVLYHRRSPLDHIAELLSFLRPGGELVLETLVHTDDSVILMPGNRYAQMRNVWFLPGTEALLTLMRRAGVEAPRIVDVTTTTTDEQRQTGWMTFQSLSDFLDPDDPTLTVEGYPAPTRAIAIGTKSGH